MATIKDKTDHVTDLLMAANVFDCKDLQTICRNVLDDTADLNPSIGKFLHEHNVPVMSEYVPVLAFDVSVRAFMRTCV